MYIVATELEQALGETASDLHPDEPAARLAARERDEVDALVAHDLSSDIATAADETRKCSGEPVRLED